FSAFCRVFRIGQEYQTYVTRFVVKNTVDEKLQQMQVEKSEIIEDALGDDGRRLKKYTHPVRLRLHDADLDIQAAIEGSGEALRTDERR
ncbi:hypothetical protein LTR16_004780, partial [Cryomyces antarcticus]